MASCSLSGDGMARQGARYAALARDVAEASRAPRRLDVAFAAGYDRALLDEAIAIERECCPFFAIELDHDERRLAIELPEGEDTLLLDGITSALTGQPAAAR
jgi:hypothetical protein